MVQYKPATAVGGPSYKVIVENKWTEPQWTLDSDLTSGPRTLDHWSPWLTIPLAGRFRRVCFYTKRRSCRCHLRAAGATPSHVLHAYYRHFLGHQAEDRQGSEYITSPISFVSANSKFCMCLISITPCDCDSYYVVARRRIGLSVLYRRVVIMTVCGSYLHVSGRTGL